MDWADNDDFKKNQTVPDSCCIDASKPNCAGKVLKTNNTKNIHDEVHAQIRLLVQKVDKRQLCYRASTSSSVLARRAKCMRQPRSCL